MIRSESRLKSLVIAQEDYGLGGRLLLTFAAEGKTRAAAAEPAAVGCAGAARRRPACSGRSSLRGVVVERAERTIAVAFEEPDEDLPDDATWRLDLSPDEASRQRQLGALYRVQAADEGPAGRAAGGAAR